MEQLPTPAVDNFRQDEVICLLGQSALLRFTEDLDGYRELMKLAYDRDRERRRPRSLDEVGRDLRTEQRRAIEKAISGVPQDLLRLLESATKGESPSPEGKRHPYSYEQLVVGAILEIGKNRYEAAIQPLVTACRGDPQALSYGLAFLRWKHKNHADQLAKAVIPMAVSGFEGFLAELLRTWYLLNQQTLTESEKKVELGKLLAYATKDDQLRFVIDEQIAEILRQSPQNWQDRIRRDGLDLNIQALGGNWQEFCLVLARRNVLIHSDDRVDEKYLERTPWLQPPPDVGTPLGTDHAYASKSLTTLQAKAEALTIAVLAQLVPHSEDLGSLVVNLTYEALRHERWEDVVTMTSTLLTTQPPEHEFHEVRINCWMAKMKLHQDVRDEIAAWTPPADNSRVTLGLAALRGQTEATVMALRKCAQEGEDVRRLADWPVLVDLGHRNRIILQELQRHRRSSSAPPPRAHRRKQN